MTGHNLIEISRWHDEVTKNDINQYYFTLFSGMDKTISLSILHCHYHLNLTCIGGTELRMPPQDSMSLQPGTGIIVFF